MLSPALVSEVNALSADDINELVRLVNARSAALRRVAAVSFEVGDRVWFLTESGYRITGTIARVVRGSGGKFDLNDCSDGRRWRVSAAMLKRL